MISLILSLIFLSVMNFFIFKSLSTGFNLSTMAKKVLGFSLIAASVFYPAVYLVQLAFKITPLAMYPLLYTGKMWILSIPGFCTLAALVIGLAAAFPGKERLRLLALALFPASLLYLVFRSFRKQRVIFLLAILALAGGYSLYNASRVPVVRESTVPIKKLPKEISGFTIVQLSDLHLGDLVSPSWFQKTVEKINSLEPDLVVITGDLIDRGIGDGSRFIAPLRQLQARCGVFAVTGNHEYYNNRLHLFLDICRKTGIRALRNNSVTINNGIQLVGMNDWIAGEYDEDDYPASVSVAMRHVDPRKPVIMLFHRPELFAQGIREGVDLQLSGHTHAGQIPPLDLFSYLLEEYFYGLYREGESYIYVTGGTGLYAIPMRLFSRNEITRITLKPGTER